MQGHNPELDLYLNHVAQQANWLHSSVFRIGTYLHNPEYLLINLLVEPPSEEAPLGQWVQLFHHHHNAVELAAHLLFHARHLQYMAGVPMETANQDTFDLLFQRVVALNNEIYANRETQP